jgi:methyl-accepting chemotaxis protein
MFGKQASFRKRFTLLGSVIVFVCVTVTALVCLWQVRVDMVSKANSVLDGRVKVFWEFILAKTGNLSSSGEKLEDRIKEANFRVEEDKFLVGSYNLSGDTQIVDRIKDLFGGNATVFMGDTRVATNVKKEDGARALGTKLVGPAHEVTIKNGKAYRGEVDILGNSYFAAYDPIKNQAGETVGALYVGVPKDEYLAAFRRITYSVIAAGAALILLVNVFLFSFVGRLFRPLKGMVETAHSLAEGDLTIQISAERKDEVGQLMKAMGGMVERWREVVTKVKSVSDSIALAGHAMSGSAEEMARGSADQASRSTQLATSAEEMSQTVLDIARNTGSIANSSSETVAVAKEGETIVNRAVNEVKEIAHTVDGSARFVRSLGERSLHIGEIVSVINDIADQTNLLALNAAIEAARAGEQGRGFAVVADEVRKLAERTAQATSEISGMIKAIQDEVAKAVDSMEVVSGKVNVGVELSTQAGEALAVIVHKADELQLMVQQIASATEQMGATSEEITRDIEQIATGSRETSSNSEQTARAATQLSGLSEELQKTVGEFKLS